MAFAGVFNPVEFDGIRTESACPPDFLIMANPPQLPNLSNSMGLKTGLLIADVVKIIRTGDGGKAKANVKPTPTRTSQHPRRQRQPQNRQHRRD
jgi:hypothetical protein